MSEDIVKRNLKIMAEGLCMKENILSLKRLFQTLITYDKLR